MDRSNDEAMRAANLQPNFPMANQHVNAPDRAMSRSAMEALFLQEEGALLRFAFGIVRRREVAEELVQDGFIQLIRHEEELENPRAWLYRAVRNLSLNYLRKHRREMLRQMSEGDEVVSDEEEPDARMERLERVGMLRLCMAGLASDDQTMLRMKFEDGKSYKEIAAVLKIGIGNVGYRLHHLLKQLAGEMGRERSDETDVKEVEQ